MAFSQSVHKSQIPINCHLCDIEKNIKWKCLECELLMCDNCKIKRHPRIKNSNDHKVIDIKDVGLHGEELNFTTIKCRDHPGQTCCLFCKSCNSLVCPTCVSKVHKKHDLIEISEAYNTKKDNLRRGKRNIEMGKREVFAKKGILERLKNGENTKYISVMGDIKNQGEALKQVVDKHIEKIRNEVDQDRKTVLQSIDAELDTISRSIQKYDDKNNEIEDLVNNTDSAKFFHEVSKIEDSMDVPAPKNKSTYKSIPDFVPGTITQSNIGELQSKDTPLELSVSIQINKQYQTEHTEVSNISALSDKSILINCSLDEKFIKVKPEGNILKTIYSFNVHVFDMALTVDKDHEDILLVTEKFKIQKPCNTTGKVKDTVYDMSPFVPSVIHVTSNRKVIVGGGYHNEQCRVIVMNEKGEHETVYEHDQYNHPIFAYPRSIASTRNMNIHVVDYDSDSDRGKVVVLGQGSDVINTYAGNGHINQNQPFKPGCIVTTQRDNVIVLDLYTFILHILDKNGKFLTFYDIFDIGIICPCCLAFTQTGQLLIGCTRPANSTAKEAKIYEVTISGC